MSESMWVGKDEHEGVRAQPRKDVKPPPHWRLEAIAADAAPAFADRARPRAPVFIQAEAETSDVWLLDLEGDGAPERLTTGREPVALLGGHASRASRPTARPVAYADDDHVWLAPTAGGPPRKLVEGGEPGRGSTTHAWSSRSSATTPRGSPWSTSPTRGRGAWPSRTATSTPTATRARPPSRPTAREVAYTFTPRADLNRSEIRVAALDGGAVRAVTGTPLHARQQPGVVARRHDDRLRVGAQRLLRAAPRGRRGPPAHERRRRPPRAHVAPGRHGACWPSRGRRNRFDVVVVDAATGAAEVVADGGTWGCPAWTPAGAIVGTYEDHATAPELRLAGAGARATPPLRARRGARRTPTLEEVSFTSLDGLEIPAFLRRPRNASPERPVPAIVYPHGGPTDAYLDDWDGHAQYFVDKGYAWLAPNFRGSTGYGRDYERLNHGVWGVKDTEDCLAAADYLRTLDWVDGERLGIFGASYGSYMALAAVTDDPEQRFRCAVAKYGDCDIVTSWAQGDRYGVQDLERMMGPPVERPRGLPRRLALPPPAERAGAAAHRPRRARRAREPQAVRATGRRAAPAGQDVRVRDLPDRGPRAAAHRPAAGLLPPPRALPGLASHVSTWHLPGGLR